MKPRSHSEFMRFKHQGNYPGWICWECGDKYGRMSDGHCATFHEPDKNDPDDKCGWCGTQDKALTEPRDFGYPKTLELAI